MTPDKISGSVCTAFGYSDSKFARKKTELLIAAAKEALEICAYRESFPTLISLFAKILLNLRQALEDIEKTILSLALGNDIFSSSVNLLTSIPGIGQYSAIVILAEIGDFSRFNKPKQLTAFAGMDPGVKQSGTSLNAHTKMSKRGSPYLRAILDLCTHVAVHPNRNGVPANPVLADYYSLKRQSRPAVIARCACMHKMLGYIFAVLREQQPFVLRTPDEHLQLMRENMLQRTA